MDIEILGGEQDWGTCEIPKDSIKNCVIKIFLNRKLRNESKSWAIALFA